MEASSQSRTEEESVSMKILPIETMTSARSDLKPSLTWMSWFSRMIIVVSPVSVDKGWTCARFKFFSRATLLHLVCFFGPMLLLLIIAVFNDNLVQTLTKAIIGTFGTYNLIDSVSLFLTIAIIHLSNILPIILSAGIPKISVLALAGDLRWPKYGFFMLSGAFLYVAANLFSEYFLG